MHRQGSLEEALKEIQKSVTKEPLRAHSAPSLPQGPANGQLRLMRSCLGEGVGCHGLPPTANPTEEHYCLLVKRMFNVSLAVWKTSCQFTDWSVSQGAGLMY